MTTSAGSITVRLDAKTRVFNKAMQKAASKMSKLDSTARKVAKAAKLMTGALGIGFALAVKQASDFEETTNVILASFGKMTPVIEDWAKTTGKAVGRSTQQMREFAGSTQALLAPMVGSQKEAAKMSTSLATLAVDLGSFFNVADGDSLAALKSGLAGEAEPLKRFGVLMNQASLNTFLFEQGINKTTKQLSEAEKVSLRYAFIMERTKAAQGDAAKTADGFANTAKSLQGEIANLAVAVGNELLPAATATLALLRDGLQLFNALPGPIKVTAVGILTTATTMATLAGATAIAWPHMAKMVKQVGKLSRKLPKLSAGLAGASTSMVAFGRASLAAGGHFLRVLAPMVAAVAAVAAAIGALVLVAGAIARAFQRSGVTVAQVFDAIGQFAADAAATVKSQWTLVTTFWGNVWKSIVSAAAAAWGAIAEFADPVVGHIRNAAKFMKDNLIDAAALPARAFLALFGVISKVAQGVLMLAEAGGEFLGLDVTAIQSAARSIEDSMLNATANVEKGIAKIKAATDLEVAIPVAVEAATAIANKAVAIGKKIGEGTAFVVTETAKDIGKAVGFGLTESAIGVKLIFDEVMKRLGITFEGGANKLEDAISGALGDLGVGGVGGTGPGKSPVTDGAIDAGNALDGLTDSAEKLATELETTSDFFDKMGGKAFGKVLSGAFGMGKGEANEFGKQVADSGFDPATIGNSIGIALDKSGALGGGAASALSAVGGAAGAGTGIGAIAGVVVPIIIEVVKSAITEGFELVVGVVTGVLNLAQSALQGIGDAVKNIGSAAASLIPEERAGGAVQAAFNPVVAQGLAVAFAFAALAPAATVAVAALSVMATPFIAAAAVVAGFVAAISPLLAVAALMISAVVAIASVVLPTLAAAFVAVAAVVWLASFSLFNLLILMTGFGPILVSVGVQMAVLAGILTALVVPAVMAFSTALVPVAAMLVLLGAAIGFALAAFSLLQGTEAVGGVGDAFEASMDRVTAELEPLGEKLFAFAGLFDALMSVLIPMFGAFGSMETPVRLVFEAFKQLAIMAATLAFGFAILVNVFMAGVIAVATALAGVVDSNALLQDSINTVSDAWLNGMITMINGLRSFLDGLGVLSQSMNTTFENALTDLRNSVGGGDVAANLSDALMGIADEAGAMSPDLEAMAAAIQELTGLTFEEAISKGKSLAAQKDLDAAMREGATNIPAGFKVAGERLAAIVPGLGNAPVPSETDGPGSALALDIETLIIVTDNVDDLFDQLQAKASQRASEQSGGGQGEQFNNGGGM